MPSTYYGTRGMVNQDNDLPPIGKVLEHYGAKVPRDWGQVNIRCPFHPDSHSSGTANMDKNIFICFACGVKGNSIQIIADREGLSINEAKRFAERTLGQGHGEVRGKHLSGGGLPKKQRNSNRNGTAGAIRRSRGA